MYNYPYMRIPISLDHIGGYLISPKSSTSLYIYIYPYCDAGDEGYSGYRGYGDIGDKGLGDIGDIAIYLGFPIYGGNRGFTA